MKTAHEVLREFEAAVLHKSAGAEDVNVPGKHILEDAKVYGNAEVEGDAKVTGSAQVAGNAWVYDKARIGGRAVILGGEWDGSEGEILEGRWKAPGVPAR